MSRLWTRASITVDVRRATCFKLSIRAPYGEIRQYLPGSFVETGTLRDGDLVLMDDPDGRHKVHHVSTKGLIQYDYIEIHSDRSGICISESMSSIDLVADAEDGLLSFGRVDSDQWVPLRYAGDPRVMRVARLLAEGRRPTDVVRMLPLCDKKTLEALTRGHVRELDAPAHVAYLARRLA